MAEHDETFEVVILGGGLAGISAAYELRDRSIAVLESLDRVGGRTYSGGDDQAWFNIGAQLVSSERVMGLARELGLDLVPLRTSDFGFAVDGKFARGKTSERLFLRMNLSPLRKLDFGITSLRLQRKLKQVQEMDARERSALDRESLSELVGWVSPTTARLLSECCENAAGIPSSGASALFGLAYGLGAFMDPRAKENLYSVRGGTQQICLRIEQALPPDTVRLGAQVQSVRQTDDGVVVTYRDRQGAVHTVTAEQCICALPAWSVLEVVDDLPADKTSALRQVTPYCSLISVAWPVADNRPTPWDGVFFCPVSGSEGFNLVTNYGFLTKQTRPELGGYLNTLSAGVKADLFEAVDDDALLDREFEELGRLFPGAQNVLDRSGAVVQRWPHMGLPPMRPGYLDARPILRRALGNIHFCGDYTSEPGLPGANGSGHYAAREAAKRLSAVTAAA
jgi:protoporphyrinogen oxidase